MAVAAGCVGESDRGSDPSPAFDWLIHGGSVIDGSGSPALRADVLIRDGRIVHIGSVDADTLRVAATFDATGRVVAPGFIDVHAHGDPLETPEFRNFLAMGVTTIVLGLDGSSPEAGRLASHLAAVDDAAPGVNVAYLIGHNTVRHESGVGHGVPDATALDRMAALVGSAMDAGAFGLSLGLEYDPGGRADMDELVAIARPVASRSGVVMSHMRNEDVGRVRESLRELIEQGRRSGARVHASHLKIVLGNDPAEAEALLEEMAAARRDGVAVTADVYPYTASFTGLAILFPEWARPPHDYAEVAAARGEELARHLRERVEARNGPGATLFGTGPYAGRTLEETARAEGRAFERILVDLGPAGARAAYFVMDDAVMTTFLRDPHVAVASDGGPTMHHPRGYGTFARVLSRHVRGDGRLPLEEAVRKMTGLPASIVGLDDPGRVGVPRGSLRAGWAADVVVFDPDRVEDRADFEAPHRLATGMTGIWIGGELVWRDGGSAGEGGAGRVIRRVPAR